MEVSGERKSWDIFATRRFWLSSLFATSFAIYGRQKLISIELVLTGEEMFVNADLVKIQQVLYNLVDNAIKFSHKNSCIKIETIEKSEQTARDQQSL